KEIQLRDGKPTHPEYGVTLAPVAEKMSKARGNVVNPDDMVREFGADSLRVYEMFMGPLEQVKPWQTSGIQGARRFLDRVDAVARRAADVPASDETERLVHRTVKKVTEDIEALRLHTLGPALVILGNHLARLDAVPKSAVERLLLCLAPLAPHLAEELWAEVHGRSAADPATHDDPTATIADQPWPTWDEAL